VRALIGEYLHHHGCQVFEADNGVTALRELNDHRPDVLILDLMMPRLGGLAALRLMAPAHPHVRVIVITGRDDPELAATARSLGAQAVLVKPLDLAALTALVHGAPAAVSSPGRAPAPAREPVTPVRMAAPARVLIVDDDPEIVQVLREILEREGYLTRSEESGAGAFWAIMQEMPDVVLLDISMPGMSGVEIMPALRFVKQDVKIIMVSGASDMTLAKQALAYGAFDFLTKPVDVERLREAVRQAVGAVRGDPTGEPFEGSL
jgi:DNA-binding NtrC family response regulator